MCTLKCVPSYFSDVLSHAKQTTPNNSTIHAYLCEDHQNTLADVILSLPSYPCSKTCAVWLHHSLATFSDHHGTHLLGIHHYCHHRKEADNLAGFVEDMVRSDKAVHKEAGVVLAADIDYTLHNFAL